MIKLFRSIQSELVPVIEMTRTTSFGSVTAKIRPYMQFFFWLGQGPSPVALQKLSTKVKILRSLPTLFSALCHVCLFTSGAILQNVYRETYGKHNNLITNLYLIMELTTNMIIYLQCAINKDVLSKIVGEFTEVAQMISSNFECQPEWDKSFKRIRMKMFCILFAYLVDSCIYLVPTLKVGKRMGLSLHFDILQSGSTIGCMHSLLYINLLDFYMKSLNTTLKYSMPRDIHTMADGDEQIVFLKKMKMIHFRLWSIAQDISQFFGFGLGAILLRNFVDSTFGIYWAFLIINNQEKIPLIQMIRAYVVCILLPMIKCIKITFRSDLWNCQCGCCICFDN